MNSAPTGFKTAVQAAVQFFDTTFTNNISVNIGFGWGEVDGHTLTSGSVAESEGNYYGGFSYQDVRSALAAAAPASSAQAQAVASLPLLLDPSGNSNWVIPTAEEKALGLYTHSASAMDGYVGLSSADTFTFDPNHRAVAGAYDAIGTLEHEISEVLGRLVFTSQADGLTVDNGPLDLFRYTSYGGHSFVPGPAYFSLDGGATSLKQFNDGSGNAGDGGDWASSGQIDAFDAFGKLGAESDVSAVDISLMQLLGYTAAPGGPTITIGNSTNNYTASFSGVLRQYTVGAYGATVTGGPEGVNDVLTGFHRIQFIDGYLDYAPTDPAAQVYRVYEATLNRAPDPEGLANWTNALNTGTSLQSVADGFVNSTEFQQTYGALDNTGFVTLLYENVLHRAPDAIGLANWVNALNGGETRAQVVTGFSQSPEDINTLAAAVQQGLWVGSVHAAEVARLYDTVLGRLPDLSGLTNWTHSLDTGTSLQTVASGFTGSPEFQATYGSLNDTQFVQQLYENTLHRPADSAGLTNWVNALSGGESRTQVVVSFSESAEHIADTAAHIDYGIWLA